MSRARRRLTLAASICFAAVVVAPARADRATADLLAKPLVCTLKTVQSGQFRDLDFAAGPSGGAVTVTVAASPQDLQLGRAALIEEDRADIVDIDVDDRQLVLSLHAPDGTVAILSLFTVARSGAVIPAALSRQTLLGSVPIVVQSAGTCAVAGAQTAP